MRALVFFFVVVTSSAWAQDAGAPSAAAPVNAGADAGTEALQLEPPPTGDEIKRVLDYMENGKARGPALMDLVACLTVDQNLASPTRSYCLEPARGPVKKGTIINAWMHWLCPKGGKYEDISLQWMFEGQVRNTVDLVVQGVSRTRAWRPLALTKVGTWQIRVVRGERELGLTSITVEQ